MGGHCNNLAPFSNLMVRGNKSYNPKLCQPLPRAPKHARLPQTILQAAGPEHETSKTTAVSHPKSDATPQLQ